VHNHLIRGLTQKKREAGDDLFLISATSTARNDKEHLDARSKKEAFAYLHFCSGENCANHCATDCSSDSVFLAAVNPQLDFVRREVAQFYGHDVVAVFG